MTVALFVTIWLALVAFVATEAGRRPASSGMTPARWLDAVSLAGVVLLIVHIALAYAVRHAWSHDAAVRATAEQTASVYGLDWGGGIYINYAFALVWAVDAWQWSALPAAAAARAPAVRLALRVFYGVIIVNAAVIFVPGPRRFLGAAVVLALLWVWRPVSSPSPE
jgi:hypothetical protein